MKKDLAIKNITTNGGTQQRPVDDAVVKRYMGLIKDGVKFPPIDIIHDGKDNWLWNGFHRYHAYRKLNKKYIPALVEDGTKRDAVFFSFTANKEHGLPRQPGTAKRMLLEKIFPDKEWSANPDEFLAEWVGCTKQHISKTRIEYEKSKKSKDSGQANSQKTTSCLSGQNESAMDSEPENEDSGDSTGSTLPLKDSTGKVVPEHLKEIFSRKDEIKIHIRQLNEMLKIVQEARANNDVLFHYTDLNSFEVEAGNIKRNLRFTLPYAVCRYCGGDGKHCRACDETGFANKMRYDTTLEEMK